MRPAALLRLNSSGEIEPLEFGRVVEKLDRDDGGVRRLEAFCGD
jgi:hypothetical protein